MQRYRTHDPVDATYYLHETDGRKLLQINMKGRQEVRQNPDSVSQTIQFDEQSARQLFEALRDHFGFR